MADYIDMKELRAAKRKAVFRERVAAVKQGAKDLLDWAADNPALALAGFGTLSSVFGGTVRTVRKHTTLRAERHLKEDYVYDRSLGKYLKPRRKLSKREWQTVARRKANGEKYVNIFDDMGVL